MGGACRRHGGLLYRKRMDNSGEGMKKWRADRRAVSTYLPRRFSVNAGCCRTETVMGLVDASGVVENGENGEQIGRDGEEGGWKC